MEFKGSGFKYFFNNESKTIEEIKELVDNNTTVSVKGLEVHYFSPKKELNKTEKLLKEAEQHQEKNGGRVKGIEFPFNAVLTPTREMAEKIENYISIDSILDFQHSLEKAKIKEFIETSAKKNKSDREQQVIEDWNKIELNGLRSAYLRHPCKNAKKETEGKLFYELDFNFIKQMAERMQSNKDNSKYDLWNWKKPMTPKGITDLKQATLRHLFEVLEGNYEDDGRTYGHLEAISNNVMMINYQLKNLK